MKVAIIARSTLQTVKGGDTTQVLETAAALRSLEVQADVYRASDKINYDRYDLLHFFNIQRPADHLYHIARANKPYVLSPVYVDYSGYDRHDRRGLAGLLTGIAGKHGAEYIKNMARFALGQDTMRSRSYILGHLRAMRRVLRYCSLLLPNSHAEYQRLLNDTGIECSYRKIPNGINPGIFLQPRPAIERVDSVLCVAQIYGRKNQHRLIEACRLLDVPLTLIGKSPPNHRAYGSYCRRIAGKHVRFYDFMPQSELLVHYQQSKVHALPSWFETTGLVTLEAAAMGCNTVVGTCPDTLEYFSGMAEFCHANAVESIAEAISRALATKSDIKTKDYIARHYTWPEAARQTLEAYQTATAHA